MCVCVCVCVQVRSLEEGGEVDHDASLGAHLPPSSVSLLTFGKAVILCCADFRVSSRCQHMTQNTCEWVRGMSG